MSADLYGSEIPEDRYGSMMVSMNVHNHLDITVGDPGREIGTKFCSFVLPPTSEGLKEAENIIKALQEWAEHIRKTK